MPEAAAIQAEPVSSPEPTLSIAPDATPEPQAEPQSEPKAYWPEDWRTNLSGGDEKLLNRLTRFSEPSAILKSWLELEKRSSAGEFIKPLPANATEADIQQYRERVGIPAEPKGYLTAEHKFAEQDQPVLESFLGAMHKNNLAPQVVKPMLDWYQGWVREQESAVAENDKLVKAQSEDALRVEWGADFRGNINAGVTFLQTQFPDGAGAKLMTARYADGTQVASDPAFWRGVAGAAQQLNPDSTILPNMGNDLTISNEIATYEKQMREDRKAWNKNIEGQKRYMTLLESRQRK